MLGLLIAWDTTAATACRVGAASSVEGTGVSSGGIPSDGDGVCQQPVARPKLRTPSVVTWNASLNQTSQGL
ncbi:hypothetical protein GCM10009551_076360 [Nocardiopsis tropica]|nr:hypothetical protein TTY48_41680 [Tsukamurella sp. TY48]